MWDGAEVTYQGQALESGLAPGDQGRVLVSDGRATHVAWSSGQRQGQVDLVSAEDVVEREAQDEAITDHLRNSLEFEPVEDLATEQVTASRSVTSVVSSLTATGGLDEVSDEVIQAAQEVVAVSLIRYRSLKEVLAGMDEAERAEVVRTVTSMVLGEAHRSMEADDA